MEALYEMVLGFICFLGMMHCRMTHCRMMHCRMMHCRMHSYEGLQTQVTRHAGLDTKESVPCVGISRHLDGSGVEWVRLATPKNVLKLLGVRYTQDYRMHY